MNNQQAIGYTDISTGYAGTRKNLDGACHLQFNHTKQKGGKIMTNETGPISRKNTDESTDPTVASPRQHPGYYEEIGLETLTKRALDRTIHEGSASTKEH